MTPAARPARSRSAASLAELSLFGSIALALVAMSVALLARALRQDTWNGGRLTAVSSLSVVLESLRRDLWSSDAARTYPQANALALRIPADGASPDIVVWAWSGPGRPVERNRRAVGTARPLDFGVRVHEPGTAVLSLAVPSGPLDAASPRPVAIGVPLVIPDALWRERYAFWSSGR